jgi:hypothetical protein
MSVWTRHEVLDFEAGLNVKESLDLCHIYRQSMAKGKWPVCQPPSSLNVCTSDKCFVRYTNHGTLAVGLKFAVCVGVFSAQGKGGVSFGENRTCSERHVSQCQFNLSACRLKSAPFDLKAPRWVADIQRPVQRTATGHFS